VTTTQPTTQPTTATTQTTTQPPPVTTQTLSGRVSLCHNDFTIEVSANAVRAHFAHGDTLGPCS
jgi:hypothetical protein